MARKLNFNNYKIVKDVSDATLIIEPFDVNDTKQPLIYLKSKLTKELLVRDVKDAIWLPTIKISLKGEPSEYIARVKWWFDSATEEYKKELMMAYTDVENITSVIKKAKLFLLTDGAYKKTRKNNYFKRRKDINRFLKVWLNNSLKYSKPKRVSR